MLCFLWIIVKVTSYLLRLILWAWAFVRVMLRPSSRLSLLGIRTHDQLGPAVEMEYVATY